MIELITIRNKSNRPVEIMCGKPSIEYSINSDIPSDVNKIVLQIREDITIERDRVNFGQLANLSKLAIIKSKTVYSADAPIISYNTPNNFVAGDLVNLVPTNSGDFVLIWEDISTIPLSSIGLSLDPLSGTISGTVIEAI